MSGRMICNLSNLLSEGEAEEAHSMKLKKKKILKYDLTSMQAEGKHF